VNTWQGPPPKRGMHSRPAPTPGFAEGVQVVGVRVALMMGATPVPLSVTGEPVTATVDVRVSEPPARPFAVGLNTTFMVQLAPAAKPAAKVAAVHEPPDWENSLDPEMARVIAAEAAAPLLVNVSVFAALVVPVTTFPKANGPPVTASTGTGGVDPNSTAPGSNLALSPGSGLRLPKKSNLGTSELA